MADPSEPRHPIAVVAERTGLSQDVLRVWERRYGAVTPGRGAGGQRRYSDRDIERLRLLSAAANAGRSIGQIARMHPAELERLVSEDAVARPVPESEDATVADALRHALALDAVELDALLRQASVRLGLAAFVARVAGPVLRRVGDEWHAGRLTPAHEHLVSSTLDDILAETMRAIARTGAGPRIVVTTPRGERHAIGATLVGAVAAAAGWSVIYLGADLPARDIAAAAAATQARAVALSIVYLGDRAGCLAEVTALRELLPPAMTLIAGGAGAIVLRQDLEAQGVRVAESFDELRALRGAA